VWLDGSSAVGNWVKSGTHWVANGWTAQFDSSPTYTFGAPDNTGASWQFVNQAYPMAAHPDQVWIDGVAQRQVSSAAAVTPGTFYVNYAAKQLILGSDPSGHAVRASDIAKAASIRGAGSVLRGIGIHRFAPSVPHMGAVTAENPGITIENVVITDNATTGLFVMQSGSTVRDVTLARNGMLGASMSTADSLTVDGVLAFDNNTEHFNNSPVSGGVKISRSRNVQVTNSVFVDNRGPGLWFDESVYNGTVKHNDIVNNDGHGLILEISSTFAVVDNVVSGNNGNGMKINDTSQVRVWNNTVTGNDRNINIVQDTRRASNLSVPGHDPRRPKPDPTVTWINGPVQVMNNIISKGSADCLLCVQDYSGALTASQMGVTAQGNVFERPTATAPRALVIWSRGKAAASQYPTLAAFSAGTGQGTAGLELTGTSALSSNWSPVTTVSSKAGAIAQPIPAEIASLTGLKAGAKQLGASL
jgi:trimeric autotransporter adhesin